MPQRLNVYVRTAQPAQSPVVTSNAIAALKKNEAVGASQLLPRTTTAVRIAGLYGHNPKQNNILAALPPTDYDRILPHLELVSMQFAMTIGEAGVPMQHVYFPTSSIVSLLYDTREGASAETAVVGNEGVVGVNLFMGGGSTQSRAMVKSAGYGFRLRASVLREEFGRGGMLQHALLRYTQALLTQMSQTAVCNRHHSVTQQLCRWLLLSLDRLPGNELNMTQEMIANMLGVRRESITKAAETLQDEGLILYSRGHITVTDRPGLEGRVCECYAGVKKEYDRLLPEKAAA